MVVISIPDQMTWREINLAKKSLRWHENEQRKGNDKLDFNEAIDKERSLIRSFFTSLYKDQAA